MHGIHRSLLPVALAGALMLSAPAGAGQSSSSFRVTATVGAACTVSAPDLAFGTYTGTAVSGQTTITLDCTQAASGTLTLTGSSGQGNDGFAMLDTNGSNVLDYDLYQDANQSTQILSGQGFASSVNGKTLVDVFGAIPTGQNSVDGDYSDTVSIVFDF
jgi:spore coat protein U-like protein